MTSRKKGWYTYDEIAEKHSHSRSTIDRWSMWGRFPNRRKEGRKYIIPESDYLKACEVDPVENPLSKHQQEANAHAAPIIQRLAIKARENRLTHK